MSFLDKILKKTEAQKKKGEKKEKSDTKEVRRVEPEKIIVGVLKGGHVTEKTSGFAKENKYVFVVGKKASKLEIKRAVERRFGASVTAVNTVSLPGKERRRGNQVGFKPGFKKAIVTVKEGQTIEIQ